MDRANYNVFVSHASGDTWIARQMANHIEEAGAGTFLDAVWIDHGDDFEDEVIGAADWCDEMVVLLTPWSVERQWLWMEVGLFLKQRKRIVSVTYRLDVPIDDHPRVPVPLKRRDSVSLEEFDASYVDQLRSRLEKPEQPHG